MELFKSVRTMKAKPFGIVDLTDLHGHGIADQFEGRFIYFIIRVFAPITFKINAKEYRICAGELVFVGPRYTIEIVHSAPENGFLLWFDEEFYEKSNADSQILNSDLFFGDQPFVRILDQLRDEVSFREIIVNRMINNNPDGVIGELLAHHCIESLLLDGYQAIMHGEVSYTRENMSALTVFNRFSVLLHKHYRENTSVQFYAKNLHLTPRKLTELCIAVTGKSAKSIISTVVTKKALRFLKYTDLSISQISYEMGFSDESNFRNFVKRQTGSIPRSYR